MSHMIYVLHPITLHYIDFTATLFSSSFSVYLYLSLSVSICPCLSLSVYVALSLSTFHSRFKIHFIPQIITLIVL